MTIADPAAEARDRFRRVAITHEWLTVPGGSELVVRHILDLFPDAEIFTSVYDREALPEFRDHVVHTSFLDRVPGATRHYPRMLPLMDRAFRSFDLNAFDLVISSNHACAKNVTTPESTRHVCYCHTPMRYAWDPSFMSSEEVGPLARLALPPMLAHLRRRDLAAAALPDAFVANSTVVRDRIRDFYGRDSVVIHPPVETEPLLKQPRAPGDYYLHLGRLVPYKRADLTVAACAQLGRPLKVAGDGRALDSLRASAPPNVEFLGRVSDEQLRELLAGALALVFPGEEDFGIVPVEAQAAGVPVIAYGRGGATDSVVDGQTGLLFSEQTPEGLVQAILAFEDATFDEDAIRDNARGFAPDRFRREFASFVVHGSQNGHTCR